MNYIKEINSFYDWLLYNTLSTGAIALWHALMSINNKAGWADEFTVANLVLQGLTGLSRQGLDKARNVLIQKGLVQYKKGTSNQAGKYKMVRLDSQKVGTVVDTQQNTKEGIKDVECKKVGTEVGTKGTQQESQEGRSSSTLYKLNETKLNDINTSTNTENVVFVSDDEFSELAKLYQCAGFEYDGFTPEWIMDSKEKYGFEWVKNAILESANQGVRNRKYVNRILNNWKSWGGMKLSTDKINTQSKIVAVKKTRFHNFESRTDKYTADQLEEVARIKRREHSERMRNQKEVL
jgi:DnaD/phage-associated family protein